MQGALNGVLQLAHVPGPGMLHEHPLGGRRQGRRREPVLPKEKLDKGQDILSSAVAQGRDNDGKDIETVEEILAKTPRTHSFGEVNMGTCDDAHVDEDRLACADAVDLAGLQDAQELDLHVVRHVADLVQEDGALVGQFELAGPAALLGACERTVHVPEEFALQQLIGNGPAVDGHEGLSPALACVMDGLGEQLLARAGLAADEHRGRGLGGLSGQVYGPAELVAGADQAVEGEVRLGACDLGHLADGIHLLENEDRPKHRVVRPEHRFHGIEEVDRVMLRAEGALLIDPVRGPGTHVVQIYDHALEDRNGPAREIVLAQNLPAFAIDAPDAGIGVDDDDADAGGVDDTVQKTHMPGQFPVAAHDAQLAFDGTGRGQHHSQGVRMDIGRVPGSDEHAQQFLAVTEYGRGRAREPVSPFTVVVLVVELDRRTQFQAEARGRGSDVALGPPVSRHAVALGEHGLDVVAGSHVQDVALLVHHRDHELVRRQQVVGLLDVGNGHVEKVPVGLLTIGQLGRRETGKGRTLFPADSELQGTQMRSLDLFA